MTTQNTNSAFEALKVFMVENYGAKLASGGKEITKRCHFCGDSRDRSAKHLYIGIAKDGLIKYNCFKCNSRGTVDSRFFRDLGCYDVNLITLVNENNKSNKTYTSNTQKARFLANKVPIFTYRDAPETAKKVAYLSKRLGHDFTIEDLARFKIVLNLYDYINANTVGELTRYKNLCDQIDQFFIGFVSKDNAYINMRRLVPEGKLDKYIDTRYLNYNIYGLDDNMNKFYTIPCMIDPSRTINIHIAEGAFDILGVYLNTDCDKSNSIFASIGGKSYSALVKHFILQYGFMNFVLHIYVDNDVDDYEIYKISELVKPLGCRTYIHRNIFPGEKDFGVTRDKIKDAVKLIY